MAFREREEPDGPHGLNEAVFQGMLDEFYEFRGWDEEGIPTREKLEELGLDDIGEDLQNFLSKETIGSTNRMA